MKTLVKDFFVIALAVVCLVMGNTVFAKSNGNVGGTEPQVVKAEGKFAYSVYALKSALKIRLNFDNESHEMVNVKLYDAKNNLVHQDKLKNENLRRAYDVQNIGEGVYRLEISAGDYTSTSEVVVGNAIAKNTAFNAYVSKLSENKRITVAYQNAAEGAYVTLVDSNETILYSERTEANEVSVRKLDLSNLNKGTYTVRISSGEKTVSKTYEIQ